MDLLKKIYTENRKHLAHLTRDTGLPVKLSDSELQAYIDAHYEPKKQHYPYLTYNLKSYQITRSGGFQMALGWLVGSDYFYFLQQIHPNYVFPFCTWAMFAYDLAYRVDPKRTVAPESHRFQVHIPLKNLLDGKYYWILQEAIPCQVDEKGRLVSHINQYTIVSLFTEQRQGPFESLIFNEKSLDRAIIEELAELVRRYLQIAFSSRQKQIIEIMIDGHCRGEEIKAETIAKGLDITVAAVRQHYRLILSTGNLVIGGRFTTTHDLIAYCLQKRYLPFTY